jgi:radical SAM-linked protein
VREAQRPLPPAEPRQRWRLTYARSPVDGEEAIVGRDYIAQWERALLDSGLPVVMTDGGRPRVAIGASLPPRMSARAELADLWLTARLPAWSVRDSLESVLPAGHRIVELEDIWLAAPALAGKVAAAIYLVTLPGAPDVPGLSMAVDRVLAAGHIARERAKGGSVKAYDLRPLIVGIEVVTGGPAPGLRLTTRIHPELGTGRPDEVLGAVAAEAGLPLEAGSVVRERLLLSDELAG